MATDTAHAAASIKLKNLLTVFFIAVLLYIYSIFSDYTSVTSF